MASLYYGQGTKEGLVMAQLDKFYVVTSAGETVSLYEVRATVEGVRATKLALHGLSFVAKGEALECPYLGVTREHLIFYTESRRVRPAESDYIVTNRRTSPVIAMFLDESEARSCFGANGHVAWDPRWHNQTRATMRAIGDDHPAVVLDEDVAASWL